MTPCGRDRVKTRFRSVFGGTKTPPQPQTNRIQRVLRGRPCRQLVSRGVLHSLGPLWPLAVLESSRSTVCTRAAGARRAEGIGSATVLAPADLRLSARGRHVVGAGSEILRQVRGSASWQKPTVAPHDRTRNAQASVIEMPIRYPYPLP